MKGSVRGVLAVLLFLVSVVSVFGFGRRETAPKGGNSGGGRTTGAAVEVSVQGPVQFGSAPAASSLLAEVEHVKVRDARPVAEAAPAAPAPAAVGKKKAKQTKVPAKQAKAPAAQAKTPAAQAKAPAAQAKTPAAQAKAPAAQAKTPAAQAKTPAAQAKTPAAQAKAPAAQQAKTPAGAGQTVVVGQGGWTFSQQAEPFLPAADGPVWTAKRSSAPRAASSPPLPLGEDGVLWSTYTIYFEPDRNAFSALAPDIQAQNRREIEALAASLAQNPGYRVRITGYANAVSASASEERLDLLPLSRSRAEDVARRLSSYGIDRSRILTFGAGGSFPLAARNDRANWRLNRRVECTIIP